MAENQKQNQEKIGKVTMDYTYYSGEDSYSDGSAIEDEMLELALHHTPDEFPKIIEEKKSWPIFYHFSPFRTNIIDWIPFKKTDTVLEIGSGCGAITSALAKRAGSVTCVDLSKKRSLVNAYRNQEYENITVMVGNFKEIEPHLSTEYDYVLLIGVFEYGQAYIGGDTPYEDFMKICNRHRKPEGRMVIAIENKFGLKYFAGCREDHLGTYFAGLEGYREGGSARTFTRRGLEEILEKTGIEEYSFYYPYPDYKFMTTLYSDQYLPKKGELSNNLRNFDRERLLLFDEKQVFDQIIEEKEFPLFSNSYLLVVGEAPNVLYAKFSNDRAAKWAIRTMIVQDPSGQIYVEKLPDTQQACGHLEHTRQAYESLSARYAGTKIDVNKCQVIEKDIKNGLAFEFCAGVTLESLLDDCLTRADLEGFRAWIDEYMHWLCYHEQEYPISNIDFTFPNILVDGEKWHLIDYEWTLDQAIGAKEIAFRAFYNYTLGGEARKTCEEFLMREVLQFSDEQMAAAIDKEKEFQNRITGKHASVEHVRELIGNKAYELGGMVEYCVFFSAQRFVVQIYLDYGEGFSEANSITLKDCYREVKLLKFSCEIPKDVVRIRIDPCSFRCVVKVQEIRLGSNLYAPETIETNGARQESGVVVFDTQDPNFTINAAGGGMLTVDMEVLELFEELTRQLAPPPQEESSNTKKKGFWARHWR